MYARTPGQVLAVLQRGNIRFWMGTIGQFGVGCMMRAATAFLSLLLACGHDIRLGNPAVDVDVVVGARLE